MVRAFLFNLPFTFESQFTVDSILNTTSEMNNIFYVLNGFCWKEHFFRLLWTPFSLFDSSISSTSWPLVSNFTSITISIIYMHQTQVNSIEMLSNHLKWSQQQSTSNQKVHHWKKSVVISIIDMRRLKFLDSFSSFRFQF